MNAWSSFCFPGETLSNIDTMVMDILFSIFVDTVNILSYTKKKTVQIVAWLSVIIWIQLVPY